MITYLQPQKHRDRKWMKVIFFRESMNWPCALPSLGMRGEWIPSRLYVMWDESLDGSPNPPTWEEPELKPNYSSKLLSSVNWGETRHFLSLSLLTREIRMRPILLCRVVAKKEWADAWAARGCSLNDGFLLPLFLPNVVPICYLNCFLSQPHLPQTENMDWDQGVCGLDGGNI